MTVTWNPSDKGSGVTLSNANLTGTGPEANGSVRANIGLTSGKWYWEVTYSNGTYSPAIGIADATATLAHYIGFDAHGWSWFGNEGKKYTGGVGTALGAASTLGATIGLALDMGAGTCTIYKNGTLLGTLATGLTGTIYPACGGNSSVSTAFTANFGATALAYTPPAGYLALDGPHTATGIYSTQFGTPLSRRTQAATGFTNTHFGTPLAIYSHIEQASGFTSTQFGSPRLLTLAGSASGIAPTTAFGTPRLFPYAAVGFMSTRFGTPVISRTETASGFLTGAFGTPTGFSHNIARAFGPTTRFGTPSTPTNRTQIASGWTSTRLGDPTAVRFIAPDLIQAGIALGFRATRFGTPVAAASVVCAASSLTTVVFGTPTARTSQRCTATSLGQTTMFGTPASSYGTHAAGFRATRFGTPSVRRTQRATGFGPACRFGTPNQWGPHIARSFSSTRFGQPRASNRMNRGASGFCSTKFGTPSALNRGLRATSIAPATRFGTPLLRRNPQCDAFVATSLGVVTRFGLPTA